MKSSLLVSESQTQLLIWNVAFFSAGPIHSIVKHVISQTSIYILHIINCLGTCIYRRYAGFRYYHSPYLWSFDLACSGSKSRVSHPHASSSQLIVHSDLKISSPSRRLERPSENIINRPDNLKFLLDCGDFHRAAKIDKKETVKHLMDMSMWWQASVISSGGPNLYGELTKGNVSSSLVATLIIL